MRWVESIDNFVKYHVRIILQKIEFDYKIRNRASNSLCRIQRDEPGFGVYAER
jgi:hypothetical protein